MRATEKASSKSPGHEKNTTSHIICQRLWKAPQGPLKTVSKSEFRMWFFKQKVKKNVNQQE